MSDAYNREGYCDRNGVHYIGDADTCWRCDWMDRMRTEKKIVHAVRAGTYIQACVD